MVWRQRQQEQVCEDLCKPTAHDTYVRDEVPLWVTLPLRDEVDTATGQKGSSVHNTGQSVFCKPSGGLKLDCLMLFSTRSLY